MMNLSRSTLLAVILVGLVLHSSLKAGILYVDAAATQGDNNGGSWTDAYTSLQSALLIAEADDAIHVAQGIYYPNEGVEGDNLRDSTFQLKSGIALLGGFKTGGSGTDQRDPVLYKTVLSGDLDQNDEEVISLSDLSSISDNSYHVVTVTDADETTVLDGLTITKGNANGLALSDSYGAGLFCESSTALRLRNLIISENFSDSSGGGASLSDSDATLENVTFIRNLVSSTGYDSGTGGAILINASAARFERCHFVDCKADTGGAIYSQGESSELELIECRFEANTGYYSAGALAINGGTASIRKSTFMGNIAFYNSGGAIKAVDASISMTECEFTKNEVQEPGSTGGAVRSAGTTLRMERCQFNGNTSREGGGAIGESDSDVTIVNCIFVSNASASDVGGAIQGSGAGLSSRIEISSCTFAFNKALGGDAISIGNKQLFLTNSILWGSNRQLPDDPLLDPGSTNNIIQNTASGANPLFILEPTEAHFGNLRLQAGSPAIDNGVNPVEPIELDLGGNDRIQNSIIDIGAYEGHRDDYFHLYGHLDPNDDFNGNNRSNYEDYARGTDPSSSHDPDTAPRIRRVGGELEFTFTKRKNRDDIYIQWQKSTNLHPDTWTNMQQGVDFTSDSATENGIRESYIVELPSVGPDELIFYRQVIKATPL